MHEIAFPLLVGLVILALAFDFLNGLHDAANSIATVVATRLLKPVHAVLFAAFSTLRLISCPWHFLRCTKWPKPLVRASSTRIW
jgi:hypothetical protein